MNEKYKFHGKVFQPNRKEFPSWWEYMIEILDRELEEEDGACGLNVVGRFDSLEETYNHVQQFDLQTATEAMLEMMKEFESGEEAVEDFLL